VIDGFDQMIVEPGQARALAVRAPGHSRGSPPAWFPLAESARQAPRDFVAINAGQADIQRDNIGVEAARDFECGVPSRGIASSKPQSESKSAMVSAQSTPSSATRTRRLAAHAGRGCRR